MHDIAFVPFAKTPGRPPLRLGFREMRDLGLQRRLRGRVALVPAVDLDAYRFRAVIDWIEIGLGLKAPQQFMQIQKVLEPALGLPPGRRLRVEALDEGPGRMATRFAVRVQEPQIGRLLGAVEALDRRYPLAGGGSVLVRAMEISVDARPRIPSEEARGLLLAAMMRTFHARRGIWTPERARPRFSFSRASPTFISPKDPLESRSRDAWESLAAIKRLPADATFYVGERGGEVLWRLMDKVLDQQNPAAGTRIELEAHERRVRVEVTLGSEELMDIAALELAGLGCVSFTELQGRFFTFRLPTFQDSAGPPTVGTLSARVIEAKRRRVFKEVGVLGLEAYDASRMAWLKPHRDALRDERRQQGRALERRRVGTGPTGTTIAWAELNRTMQTALRHLQERVRKDIEEAAAARAQAT